MAYGTWRPHFPPHLNRGIRIELDSSTNAGEGAYAYSDGWQDEKGEEQFILCDKNGVQYGRFGEREIRNFEKRRE